MRNPRTPGAGITGAHISSLGGDERPIPECRPQAQLAHDQTTRLIIYQAADHLHQLGPRAVGELLLELPVKPHELLQLLAPYRKLTLLMVRAAGGDRFPQQVLEVPQGVLRRDGQV